MGLTQKKYLHLGTHRHKKNDNILDAHEKSVYMIDTHWHKMCSHKGHIYM